jgi:hypothetical protein
MLIKTLYLPDGTFHRKQLGHATPACLAELRGQFPMFEYRNDGSRE